MGTDNPNYKSTYNLLRGLRELISIVITGVISTLNLQVGEGYHTLLVDVWVFGRSMYGAWP